MKTSVIITVFNRSDYLQACLTALALQDALPDEVVVSDDGSDERHTDAMLDFFKHSPLPIRYVRQDDRGYRLAAARNNAVRAATGDYIVSLDCDILLLPNALRVHLDARARGRFLAGNRALLSASATQELLTRDFDGALLCRYWEAADQQALLTRHRKFTRDVWLRRLGLARRHCPKILGCHFSLFREDIERVNGFDEDYEGWGFEDDDFCRRLHQAGIRGYSVIPMARALHLWHAASAGGGAGPNRARFNRRRIPTRCRRGLQPPGPPSMSLKYQNNPNGS